MSGVGTFPARFCPWRLRFPPAARYSAALARLHRPVRQGPFEGAGPWRTHPAARATHVGAAVPDAAVVTSQKAQPTALFPYLATLTEHQGSRSVMWVQGELDICSQAHLRHAIAAALDRHKPRILVLDLSELSFIDCTGLSAIVWAHRRQAEQSYELIITNIQPAVRRVLHFASLDTVLHLSSVPCRDSFHRDEDGEVSRSPVGPARGRRTSRQN